MSYTINLSEDGRYIILKHWGEINGEIAMKRIQEAHKLGAELRVTRHLVDLTEARSIDSITKAYKYAYEDMKTIGLNACVAMLVSPEDHSHDFVETVLRNTGHDVTLFRDREAAINHLVKRTQDT
jgi:hypothetical protein